MDGTKDNSQAVGTGDMRNWTWGLWEREELRIRACVWLGQQGSSICREEVLCNRKFSTHREQGRRTDLGRKDYNFSKLTLRRDILCVSLRFRREILDRDKKCGSCQHMDGNL